MTTRKREKKTNNGPQYKIQKRLNKTGDRKSMMVKYCTINEATITMIKPEGILTVKLIS